MNIYFTPLYVCVCVCVYISHTHTHMHENLQTHLSLLSFMLTLMSEMRDNIDWNYKSNTLDNKMWEELNRKRKSIIKNIPEVIKFSKQEYLFEKLSWDSNQLSQKKKN